MKVCFFASEKEREQDFARAFIKGVRAHGDVGEQRPSGWPAQTAEGFDAAVMVGVKSKLLFEEHERCGVTPIMVDKGYLRHRGEDSRTWEYWRVAVGAHHPTRYLMATRHPHDRFEEAGVEAGQWRGRGRHIILAGSSAKYHAFYGLPDPTTYAQNIVRLLKERTKRQIIYRPKPSWRDAVPIEGTTYSGVKDGLADLMGGAHCVVTHGSNICFEAVLYGVPCIVLGNAVARPISSTSLEDVEAPFMAGTKKRRQWLANLFYHQWTLEEFASGEAWQHIRKHVPCERM